jgi:hypothetical protein
MSSNGASGAGKYTAEGITIMMKKGCFLLRSLGFLGLFWVLPLLSVFPAGSLWAAEGTAHLTFQKAAPGTENSQGYVIRSGDSVSRIIQKMGWGASRLRLIRQLNPHIKDLNRIYPGQKLILTPPGERGAAPEVSNYTAKEGDSITLIIISELQADPAEAIRILRLIKQLNPEITDFNKIYPGQVIKIPRIKLASSVPAVPAKKVEKEKAVAVKPPPPVPESYLSIIRAVIEQLNGKVMTSGNHYINLPESGQITVDCAIVPIAELGDGTMVMLDRGGRMPDVLANIIQTNWPNYHLVKIADGQPISSVIQEILLTSPSFQMVKAEAPFSSDNTSPGRQSLNWLITRQSPAGSAVAKLGLIVIADKSAQPDSPAVTCGIKNYLNVCEIRGDRVQPNP